MAEKQDPLIVPVPIEGKEDMATAEPSPVYGPIENADETRQAQHDRANDSPTDVNNNAALARSQALTIDVLGKVWGANADRREKMADAGVGQFKTT